MAGLGKYHMGGYGRIGVYRVNSFGRNLISITKQAHLAIVNRRKLGDLHGEITCVTYIGMSTVDYCIYFTLVALFLYLQHCITLLEIKLIFH